MQINWDLKSALVDRYGSQVRACHKMEIRESKMSCIIRGYAQPSEKERRALERALGKERVRKLFENNLQQEAI